MKHGSQAYPKLITSTERYFPEFFYFYPNKFNYNSTNMIDMIAIFYKCMRKKILFDILLINSEII